MVDLSIIVSTNKSPDCLAPLIDSLADEAPVSGWELIIACNTPEYYGDFAAAQRQGRLGHFPVHVIEVSTPGLLAARHAGFRASKGNLCAFTDDDVSLGKEWLSAALEFSQTGESLIATGPAYPAIDQDLAIPKALIQSHDGLGTSCGALSLLDFGSQARKVDPLWVWGLNFVISREWVEAFNGFHPDAYPAELLALRGDGECGLTRKIRNAGHLARYEPRLSVYHHIPPERLEEPYLKKRYYNQGISDAYANIRYSDDWIPIFPSNKYEPVQNLTETLEQSRMRGMRWYYQQVEKNPNLLQWCKRPDYWQAQLPDLSYSVNLPDTKPTQKYNIILFGAGSAGQRAYELYSSDHKIVAFSDNDLKRIGQSLGNIEIISPKDLSSTDFAFIVICSQYFPVIYRQLVDDLNIPKGRIRLAEFLAIHP